MKNLCFCLIVFGFLLPNAGADILRVDRNGGATYTQIADAVAAAQEGDIILVDHGHYAPFTVDGKSLTIRVLESAPYLTVGRIQILNIQAHQFVNLSFPDPLSSVVGLRIMDCAGSIRVNGGFFYAGTNFVRSSSDVAFEGCRLAGSSRALRVTDSQVGLYNSLARGDDGTTSFSGGYSGGDGVYRTGTGGIFLSGVTAIGGRGGNGGPPSPFGGSYGAAWPGDGGDAVYSPGAQNAICLNCYLTAGNGGIGYNNGIVGQAGLALNTGFVHPGWARLLTATPVVFDNSMIELTFKGVAGDQVFYAVSEGGQFVNGNEIGPLLIQNPQWIHAGSLPANGRLQVTHEVSDLPLLGDAVLHFQARMSNGGVQYLTNSSMTVVLDRGLDDCTILNTPLGTRLCSPNTPNSTGQSGQLSVVGSHCVSNNQVNLTASSLPLNEFGYVLNSTGLGFVANPGGALGDLCLGGGHPIGRHNAASDIRSTGGGGYFEFSVDMTSIPGPNGLVTAVAGQGWAFQVWHRDGTESRFTGAVAIAFH